MARQPYRFAVLASFISILLTLTAPAFAMGSRENPLAVADGLIKEQKYDEAVLLLTEYIKDNPDRFDQAQARLRKIVEIRNAYNKRASDLLKSLEEDPRNQEKHLALIRELEDLERHPNPEVKRFVEDTKLTILFTVNRVKLEDIMAEAQALTEKGQYVAAARFYTTGFDLYRPEFEFGDYDPITVRAAFDRVDDVGKQIDRFEALQSTLNSATNALKDAFASGSVARIDAALPAAEDALATLANLRAETLAAGAALERQFQIFQQADPELTDSSFLPFAYRFILGRSTEDHPEGVAGAMASEWATLFDTAARASNDTLASRFSAAEALYDSGAFTEAKAAFTVARTLADQALRFQGMWSLFLPTDVQGDSRAFGKNLVAERGVEYLRLQHLRDTSESYVTLSSLRGELSDQEGREREATLALSEAAEEPGAVESVASGSLATYRGLRARTLEIAKALKDLEKTVQTRGSEVNRVSAAGFVPRGSSDTQTALEDRIRRSLEATTNFEIRVVALSAKSEVDIQEIRLQSRTADIARSRALLEGEKRPDADEGAQAPTYPTRSLKLIEETTRLLQAVRKDVAEITGRYSRETSYVASAPSVVAQIERARALDAQAVQIIGEGAVLAKAAQDRQRLAQSNKLEADRRLAEARAALAREDFDQARERLERARERYLASLSFEEDEDLRSRSDRDLVALGAQIVRAENERVVRETRRLLTEGKALYNEGEFARAEESLIQARSRWKVTHTDEPEPEVEYWLRLVQTALSVKTGRDIPQTAPLYPEMSQLLSLAKKYFEEGKTALERRDKVSALQSFDAAKKKIQEIKVVFPLNQDARVLELRINQLSDPDAFNREFARLVAQARTKIAAKEDLETVYSDLLDLEAIDPKYAGLRSLIERLEILIGLRLPPPDPKALAEARTLTAAAQKTFNSREVSRFPTALAQLNRALELDPNNENASRLKDRILTYVGGTATLVLPSAGETLFNEAVTFFQNGDYLSARIRLTRLYETYPQARKVQKASDLDARLTARGY